MSSQTSFKIERIRPIKVFKERNKTYREKIRILVEQIIWWLIPNKVRIAY